MPESFQTANISTRTFLTISTAAGIVGCSERHFRRIIEDDGIPLVQIRRKFFILDCDFQRWKADRLTAPIGPNPNRFRRRRATV